MDDTEKLAQMMFRNGLATGHGDTIDDLIFELEKQIKNISSDVQKEIDWLREVLKELEWQLKNQLYDAAYETVIHTLWPALKEKE